MSDEIRVSCPKCDAPLKIRAAYAGRRGSCKHCGGIFTIPSGQESETPGATLESRHGTGTALWEPKPSTDSGQNFKAEVERLKRYITSITKERDSLRADAVHAGAELVDARETIVRLEEAESELATTRIAAEEARCHADQLSAELVMTKNEVNRLIHEFNLNRTNFDTAIQESERRQDALNAKHESNRQEVARLSESLRIESETWQTRLDDVRLAYDEAARESQEKCNALQAELDQHISQNASLKEQLDTSETRLQREFSERNLDKSALERELTVLSEKVEELEQKLREQSNLRSSVELATEEFRLRLANSATLTDAGVEAIQNLEERLRIMTEDAQESNRRQAELESELSRKVAEAEWFKSQVARAHEFKLQIRSLLTPLGINLPES